MRNSASKPDRQTDRQTDKADSGADNWCTDDAVSALFIFSVLHLRVVGVQDCNEDGDLPCQGQNSEEMGGVFRQQVEVVVIRSRGS